MTTNLQNPPVCNDWITIPEASKALTASGLPNFSLWTLRKMYRDKSLPFEYRTIGRKCWISRPALNAYVASVLEASGASTVAASTDSTELLSFAEAVSILRASGLPFNQHSAANLWKAKRLPFPVAKVGGRLYVNKAVLLNFINTPAQ